MKDISEYSFLYNLKQMKMGILYKSKSSWKRRLLLFAVVTGAFFYIIQRQTPFQTPLQYRKQTVRWWSIFYIVEISGLRQQTNIQGLIVHTSFKFKWWQFWSKIYREIIFKQFRNENMLDMFNCSFNICICSNFQIFYPLTKAIFQCVSRWR